MNNQQYSFITRYNKFIFLMLVSILGIVSWAGPQILIQYLSIGNPALATFEEKNSISGLLIHILMLFTGIFSGYKMPSIKPWVFGITGVILLPFYTFYEIAKDPYSHNLLPLEFILTYPYLAVIIILGVFIGLFLYKKRNKI